MLLNYHSACPLNYCTKQTTMQIQAPNLVLTWLHKWVSSLKTVEQKSHHGVIKTYLGAGVYSCCREEGERQHTFSGLACAWHRSLKQGKDLSNCTTSVLLCFFRAVPIPQHEKEQSHSAKGLPGCSSALVKCDRLPHHTPNLFSSAGTSLLLLCYCRRARG